MTNEAKNNAEVSAQAAIARAGAITVPVANGAAAFSLKTDPVMTKVLDVLTSDPLSIATQLKSAIASCNISEIKRLTEIVRLLLGMVPPPSNALELSSLAEKGQQVISQAEAKSVDVCAYYPPTEAFDIAVSEHFSPEERQYYARIDPHADYDIRIQRDASGKLLHAGGAPETHVTQVKGKELRDAFAKIKYHAIDPEKRGDIPEPEGTVEQQMRDVHGALNVHEAYELSSGQKKGEEWMANRSKVYTKAHEDANAVEEMASEVKAGKKSSDDLLKTKKELAHTLQNGILNPVVSPFLIYPPGVTEAAGTLAAEDGRLNIERLANKWKNKPHHSDPEIKAFAEVMLKNLAKDPEATSLITNFHPDMPKVMEIVKEQLRARGISCSYDACKYMAGIRIDDSPGGDAWKNGGYIISVIHTHISAPLQTPDITSSNPNSKKHDGLG